MVQTKLIDELGSIEGFVASQVVALAAPGFQLLEDFARRYQHFAELRQVARWKELGLTPECLNIYVNGLFDAFDDSRPECHVRRVEQSRNLSAAVESSASAIPSWFRLGLGFFRLTLMKQVGMRSCRSRSL
ncbi:unnamed protein product [Symbiodinium sp. CCMP2592]|nr:unnamed protein product [Symbiodinium sp. CCMP2592]